MLLPRQRPSLKVSAACCAATAPLGCLQTGVVKPQRTAAADGTALSDSEADCQLLPVEEAGTARKKRRKNLLPEQLDVDTMSLKDIIRWSNIKEREALHAEKRRKVVQPPCSARVSCLTALLQHKFSQQLDRLHLHILDDLSSDCTAHPHLTGSRGSTAIGRWPARSADPGAGPICAAHH